MSFTLGTLGLSFLLSSVPNSTSFCTRTYAPTNEIRLVNGAWEIGTLDEKQNWTALSCNPELNPGFLGNGVDSETLDTWGEGHVGQGAAFANYPDMQVPDGDQFTINPMNLFGAYQIKIDLADRGWAFLDGSKYQQIHKVIGSMPVEFDSEPSNPEIQTSIETLTTLVGLFPYRTNQIAQQGQARMILAMNETEKFQDSPIIPNGFHHQGAPYYVVLYSQSGTGVRLHTLHEIGGMFRIFDSNYAQGLTWTVAYDQYEKLATTPEEKHERKCIELQSAIFNIDSTAVQHGAAQNGVTDYSHPMEYYMKDPFATGGWAIYAWVSATYWKKINTAMEARGLANIYQLINHIHQFGLEMPGDNDLDKLVAAYAQTSPNEHTEFEQMAISSFRQKTLGELKQAIESEVAQLGCQK